MGGLEGLLELNEEREKEKQNNIENTKKELLGNFNIENINISKINIEGKTNLDKIVSIFIQIGLIKEKQELISKILLLKINKNYSFDVISQAINEIIKDIKIEGNIRLHKQNIFRVLKKEQKNS